MNPDWRMMALAPLILPAAGYPEDHPAAASVTRKEMEDAIESLAEEIVEYSEDCRQDPPPSAQARNRGLRR